MKHRSLFVPFILAGIFFAPIHAAPFKASGTIRFTGAIVAPTAVPVITGMPLQTDFALTTTVEPLMQARMQISSELLDYFAQYAKPQTTLVSTVYQ